MKYQIIPVTPLQQNCSLLYCEQTMRAAVVDPGGEIERILAIANESGLEIEKILVTHPHLDHIGGVAELAKRLKLPIEGPHKEDQFWIDAIPQQCEMFNFPPLEGFTPDRWLNQGDQVSFGNITLEVLHCPGHTPGHVVFFHKDDGIAIVGDVLFQGGVGRSDFPKGDHDTLINSIKERLLPLGDHVQFIPGHGPMSTFGEERLHNPYLKIIA
ncbi:MAG: MBL fold metallo-hydrolase [Thiotrichaceae bacterium]|nr:MBL fold metallo-hydrolase [Thiotrichaceae bacterium]PCI10483.1 MAG: hypothetical protein COB71_12810 [Thiotrichales bacterium]PCI13023.1 MAG: hypothetical protein COB71_07350 [Thiotrichales bacterium]